MNEPTTPAPKRVIGRRKHKLRRATKLLLGLAFLSVIGAFVVYRATRPEVRRPGEDLADITRKLSAELPPDAPFPEFSDVTEAAGLGGFRTFLGERSSQLPEDMGSGVAWGDFDNDGDDDLFLVAAGGTLTAPPESWAESLLFENLGDGTFSRVTDFPETRIAGMAAAWGDADGDGWLDLVVSGYNSLMLFRNTGKGRFVREESFADLPGYWAGVSWADFDTDGDLDLYVCGYVKYEEDESAPQRTSMQSGTAVPYTLNPASYEPERNLLFRNDGAGRFTEEALLYGVANPEGRSLAALWHDFNADGLLDVYVANDISDNALLLNRGDTFEDVSLAAWVADYRGAMGLTAGDWNRDGDDDLFVTHWVAQENALYDSRLAENTAAGRTQLTFADIAAPLGLGQIALHSVGWATEFADFDGDGWLDLVVANGSTLETQDAPKKLKRQPAMLLWNRRGEYFHDLAPVHELLAQPRLGRGMALSDYDLDGDLDFLMVELDSGARLFRNEMQKGHWIELRLLDPGRSAGRGEGATAIVRAGGLELRRTVGGTSYLSQSSLTLHLGLGRIDRIDEIEVRWLGGETETFTGAEVDAIWELVRGQGEARSAAASSLAGTSGKVATALPQDDKQRLLEFWKTQRAAMDAMKIDGDIERAAALFERALALNPDHGDSRYYLGNLLWTLGDRDRGLAELDDLRKRDPMSHRAHKQWGVLRAMTAAGPADLDAAAAALERALEINQEGTGSLLALGEVALLQGRPDAARQRFEWACRTNPRAVGGFYLQAYLAHSRGDSEASTELLRTAQVARGSEWKPRGAAAEGDVRQRMHVETSPLARFWESWDGTPDPAVAFEPLEAFLAG
ncbi:MAG: tetratricopeptide repeat protein [bacterium]|nr:tetratricopeptide repeat protein [bacterium]